jgi:hypothetical protein
MYLLGCVDEEKEQCECTSRDSREPGRELRSGLDQLIEIRSARFSPAARAAASPQSVNNLKCLVAFNALNYAAKRSAKIPNVFVKGKIFGTHIILRSRNSCGFSHRE